KINTIEGTLRMQPTGNGIVTPEKKYGLNDTVLVRSRNLSTAMDGDTVRVALLAQKKSERPQGEVIGIVKSEDHKLTGKVQRGRNFFYVRPDTGKYPKDILLTESDLQGAKEGDKVK